MLSWWLQDVPGDDEALDLVRALVELRGFGVAEEAIQTRQVDTGAKPGAIARSAISVARDVHGRVCGHGFGHGRGSGERPAKIAEACGLPSEGAGRLDGRRHVGQGELRALGYPLAGLRRGGDALVEGRARQADGLRADADAPAVESHHRDLEALTLLPQPVGGRHVAVAEEHLARR